MDKREEELWKQIITTCMKQEQQAAQEQEKE